MRRLDNVVYRPFAELPNNISFIGGGPLSLIQYKKLAVSEILGAIDIVEGNLRAPLSLEEVSSQSKFSHWEFQRLFSAVATIPISRYQRLRRLSESLRLIKQSEMRIVDIAFEFQFNSSDAFTRAFRSHFGFTPSAWKNSDKYICTQKLNRIARDDLEYYYDKIQRKPEIVPIPERLLVGKEVVYTSQFSDDGNCADIVVPLWKNIYPRLKNHPNRCDDKLYGLAYSEGYGIDAETMKYFASVCISQSSGVVGEFSESSLPGGWYAKFEKRGLADKTSSIVNYIYGVWFPSSQYERGEGPDFELFDKGYSLSDPNSLSYFLVPIKDKGPKKLNF